MMPQDYILTTYPEMLRAEYMFGCARIDRLWPISGATIYLINNCATLTHMKLSESLGNLWRTNQIHYTLIRTLIV